MGSSCCRRPRGRCPGRRPGSRGGAGRGGLGPRRQRRADQDSPGCPCPDEQKEDAMGFKLLSVVLMLGLVLSGPLAPLAWAQEKTEGQMAPAKKDDRAWEIGAVVVNTWHVPGKAILCGLGAVSGVAVLLLTFGSGYGATARIWYDAWSGVS